MARNKSRFKRPKNRGFSGALAEKKTISSPKDLRYYADSGESCHVFNFEPAFVPGSCSLCDSRIVMLVEKTSLTSTYKGDVVLPFEKANIRLKKVL